VSRQQLITATRTALLAVALASGASQGAGPTNGTDDWKGTGNVVDTRCQGMMKGADCITHADRKAAAARARAARDAAQGGAIDPGAGGPTGLGADAQPSRGPTK
jgi:hypothetical protein